MKFRTFLVTTFGIVWLVAAALGLRGLIIYSEKPGDVGLSPQTWPSASGLTLAKHGTLLVFLHPECSCSQATLGELDRLIAHAPTALQTYAVFIRPEGWTDGQVQSSLWKQASTIPRVKVVIDSNSREAKIFDAQTSGFTLFYNPSGQLRFAGGITESRGHMGDNVGESALAQLVQEKETDVSQTNVFGCHLFDGLISPKFSKVLSQLL